MTTKNQPYYYEYTSTVFPALVNDEGNISARPSSTMTIKLWSSSVIPNSYNAEVILDNGSPSFYGNGLVDSNNTLTLYLMKTSAFAVATIPNFGSTSVTITWNSVDGGSQSVYLCTPTLSLTNESWPY